MSYYYAHHPYYGYPQPYDAQRAYSLPKNIPGGIPGGGTIPGGMIPGGMIPGGIIPGGIIPGAGGQIPTGCPVPTGYSCRWVLICDPPGTIPGSIGADLPIKTPELPSLPNLPTLPTIPTPKVPTPF